MAHSVFTDAHCFEALGAGPLAVLLSKHQTQVLRCVARREWNVDRALAATAFELDSAFEETRHEVSARAAQCRRLTVVYRGDAGVALFADLRA
jgi:hypothetical protein